MLTFAVLWSIVYRLILISSDKINVVDIANQYNIHFPSWTSFLESDKITSTIISFAILVLFGILINIITVKSNILQHKSLLPTVFSITFFSCIPGFSLYPQILICSTIFCYIILRMFFYYNNKTKSELSSSTGLYLAFASLFAPLLIFYLPVLLFAIHKFNQTEIKFKTTIASIVGVIFVYIPFVALLFFTDNLQSFSDEISQYLQWSDFQIAIANYTTEQYVVLGFLLLLQIILTIGNINNLQGNKTKTIDIISGIGVIEWASIIFIIIFPTIFWSAIAILAVCYALHFAFLLTSINNKTTTIKLFVFLCVILLAASITTLVIV